MPNKLAESSTQKAKSRKSKSGTSDAIVSLTSAAERIEAPIEAASWIATEDPAMMASAATQKSADVQTSTAKRKRVVAATAASAIGAASAYESAEALTEAEPEEGAHLIAQENFDSESYLDANPDVAYAFKAGEFASVYQHYLLHGIREGRPLRPPSFERYELTVYEYGSANSESIELKASVDACVVSWLGGLFIVGWMDDSNQQIETVRVGGGGFHVDLPARMLIRVRRPDVESALGKSDRYCYGFCGLFHCVWSHPERAKLTVEFRLKASTAQSIDVDATLVDKVELRDIAMSYLANAHFFGNPDVERIERLGGGFGGQAVRLNQSITSDMVANPYIERFSQAGAPYKGSIVVCLYGKAEFYFLQQALYAGLPGMDGYEFVYVCNSPEISEALLKEAHSANRTYGLPSTVVILGGNAGFGAANNVAVRHSQSKRVLIVNPDVFPRNRAWAENHTRLVETLPDAQTRIFGSTLYYDDGSLMHGGMYFDQDTGLSMSRGSPIPIQLMRVEHYGKGAADASVYAESRPVPAVTGAFISVDRAWYENLGGFTEDFIFGHYEDADLCLKSLERGYPAWIHDLDLWHLEGKGSTRKLPHEGGSAVNRWLFAERWGRTVQRGLIGTAPTHRLLNTQGLSAP